MSGPTEGPERRFLPSLKWAFVMNSGQRVVGLGSTFVLAAILGPHDFGLVAMALIYIALIQVFLEQGLPTAVIQREQLDDEHLDSAFWMTVAFCLGLGALSVALSGLWADVNRQPELGLLISVLSILIPLRGLTLIQQAILQRDMRFKKLALRSNVAALAGAGTGIGLAITGAGVWALVAQEIATAAVGLALLWAVSSWVPRWRFSARHARELLGFSLYAFGGNLGTFVSRRADALLIGLFLGPTVVGLYRLADQVIEGVVSATARPVQLVSLPLFSRLQNSPAALQQAVRSSTKTLALLTVPIMGVVVATSDQITALLGGAWVDAADALKLLAVAGVGKAAVLYTGPVLYALAKPQVRMVMVWSLALLSAGVVAAAGLALKDATTSEQVLGMAGTRAALFALAVVPLNLFVAARFAGLPVRSLLVVFVAPTLAGLAAVGAVAGLGSLGALAAVPPIVALLCAGVLAVVTAGAAILVFERDLRVWVVERLVAARRRFGTVERSVEGAA